MSGALLGKPTYDRWEGEPQTCLVLLGCPPHTPHTKLRYSALRRTHRPDMAEFPAKVSTQTSTADAAGHGIRFFLRPDMSFLKSIPAILMVVELVFGLLVWALVADSHYWWAPAYGWVMFVALFCWLVTLILFVLLIFQIHKRLSVIPWPMAIFIFHAAATVLYVTGFITCAASTKVAIIYYSDYNKRAAASFFACLVMIAYGASTFFSFTDWRGPGSNAASAQA